MADLQTRLPGRQPCALALARQLRTQLPVARPFVFCLYEIIAHFDPLMWVIENPATGLLKTRPFMERLPWVDVTYCKWNSVQEADAAVDQHALEAKARLMEGQYERVSQSRELLYSVPAALCEEIARAATEELAERLSIPD